MSLRGVFITKKNDQLTISNQNKFFDWINQSVMDNQELELEYNRDSVLINWNVVDNKIQSEIASNLWGKDYGYYIKLDLDQTFQSALDNFDLAKDLVK